jgi:glycosyltransferase involved in cell wall biosynthesis
MAAIIIFWSSIFLVFYAYFGYPILLLLLSAFRRQAVKKGVGTPSVSFIITAYNEARLIDKKIENTLAQDYPKDKFEVIVASDCSTDRTDDIVKSYRDQGIKLVRAPERRGKENAQKCAVDVAGGDVLVFSDVATILDRNGVRNIVRSFDDPKVGCVSSRDRFINKEGDVSGEGIYVRYEMFLRALESRVNTLVGLSGSFFAVRKDLCRPWATDLQSDFNTLINSIKKGYIGVCDQEAAGYYRDVSNSKREFDRKVRTVVRGIRVLMRSFPMFNVFRYGFFSWQLFSHKLCRWTVPFWMILAFLSNLLLIMAYLGLFILQVVFYISAILGMVARSNRKVLKLPLFLVTVNLSILMAWYKYFKGEDFVRWEPSAR